MKATILTGIGGTDKLRCTEVSLPKLQNDHANIKVSYCGVNHLDMLIRQGKRPGPQIFPHVLGSEIVGEITEIGKNKSTFAIGDKVAVYPWIFDGICKQCREGRENICDQMGTIGRNTWGGYSEYCHVPIRNLIKIPHDIKEEHVCALTLAGTTAIHLIERAKVKNNSIVVVTGATGGVGTIVLQLLKKKSCTVICATAHSNKAQQLEQLHVDHIISTKDIAKDVKKLYPQGADYAVDIVGGNVWTQTIESLGKNGTIVFCATSLDELGKIHIGRAFSQELNIIGSYGGTRKNLSEAIALLEKGVIMPTIDTVFSLQETGKAQEKIENQAIFGKLLLRP